MQAVLLFRAENWVLSVAMTKTLEGVNVGFLWKVMGKMARREWGGTWSRAAAGIFLKESGIQTFGKYIDRRQMTVLEWLALRNIYEFCDRDTCYKRI